MRYEDCHDLLARCFELELRDRGCECRRGFEIRIADYGSGILDNVKEKIFDEGFSYGERWGTGVGLYLVGKTMERYGGSVRVENNKPYGAVFILKFHGEKPEIVPGLRSAPIKS